MQPTLAEIESLFHRAIEKPKEERANFLWQECAGNTTLFEAVHRLLAADDAASEASPAATAAPATGPTAPHPAQEWRIGQRFGHYRIVRLLGKGGMGAVYLAERADGEFEQQVALKLLAPHLVEESFAEKFRAERQVLASLNHPHIVRLLDGGVSEQGEPYLATEFIAGTTLDHYASEKRLSVRERVRLFLQICSAVEYAHQNLIVHRDLKPGNILVGADGMAKLLDFGTAKLLSNPGEKTATESMMLTPKYASPEQLRNEAITTRSDVYSLGMILYELLSGARPFDSTGDAMGELARAYQFTHATALGRKISPQAAAERQASVKELQKALSGDLRAIAAKALQHEAGQRYANVGELARDLNAYLEARPVSARNPSFWYVAGKFLYRQRFAAGAAAMLLVAIGVGIWTTIREKARAERRFAQVRQLAHYQLFDLYDEAEKIIGSTRLRARLAEEALRYLDGLRADAIGDQELQVELAQGYLRVGDVLGNYTKENLGQSERAVESYRTGLDLLRNLDSPKAQETRAALEFNLALSEYATGKNTKEAEPRMVAAAKQYENLLAAQPKNAEIYLKLGSIYMNVGRVRQVPSIDNEIGDFSEEYALKAREAFEKGLTFDPENAKLLGALHMLCSVRSIWIAGAKPKEALRWSGEAEVWAGRVKQGRKSPEFLIAEANRYTGQGGAYKELGQREESLAALQKSLEFLEEIARDPDNRTAPLNLNIALMNKAQLEYDMGRMDDYLATCERAYRTLEAERLKGKPHKSFENYYARVLYYLAWAYVEQKKPQAAEFMERTYRVLSETARREPDNMSVRRYLCDIILNLDAPGYNRPEDAARYAQEMVAFSPNSLSSYDALARAQEKMGQNQEAVATLRKALAIVGAPKTGETRSTTIAALEARIQKLEAPAMAGNK